MEHHMEHEPDDPAPPPSTEPIGGASTPPVPPQTSPTTPASPSTSSVYGEAPDVRGLDPVARQRVQEQAFVEWARARSQLPKGPAYWTRAAALNQLRMGAYKLPRHPDYPATREEAQRWAAREAQGLPPNPAAGQPPRSPGDPDAPEAVE